jgi:hypothetical protein
MIFVNATNTQSLTRTSNVFRVQTKYAVLQIFKLAYLQQLDQSSRTPTNLPTEPLKPPSYLAVASSRGHFQHFIITQTLRQERYQLIPTSKVCTASFSKH